MSRTPSVPWTGGLWLVIVAPVVWTLHLLATYITAALGCGRVQASGATIQALVAAYTLLAFMAMATAFTMGSRRHRASRQPHDADSADARARFVGLATMLLAGLSLLAMAMVAGGALLAGGCG